jgi:1-acyl-sn-glycerol-3-phosphate acyltransferase
VLERGAAGALSRVAVRVLRLFRWRVVLAQPVPARSVVVFYPHTSNWDFVIGLLAKWATGIEFRWVAKHTLFATPLRALFLCWGGIPVDRRDPGGFLETLGEAYRVTPSFHLVITPEGTRSRTEHWKSGFYRLARAVDVPVGLAFLDRARREVGIGAWIAMTGDIASDLASLRAFYEDKAGWRPALAGPIRFRDSGGAR